jgi:hypothetical protein
VSKTQIRGPQKVGAGALATETDRLVVDSYSQVTTEEAKRDGQAAAAKILPLRRHLWALAERLIPERLAATLRARSSPSDPTGRDGVRELRLALADWLDPPPACRWCGLPVRPGDEERVCHAGRKAVRRIAQQVTTRHLDGTEETRAFRPWTPRARVCRASRTRKATSAVARCGTLALFPAGTVDLHTMAAMIKTKVGQASGYDVAADRDCRALLAACASPPPRDPSDANADAWTDEAARLRHLAALLADQRLPPHRPRGVPACVTVAVTALQRARSKNLRTNGRTGIAIQLRYAPPKDGVTRADVTQGAMIGLDRGALDYDDRQARFTTYAAAWARQGAGEAFHDRDLVGAPPWVQDLRRTVAERLHLHGPTACRDLLLAIEGVLPNTNESITLQVLDRVALAVERLVEDGRTIDEDRGRVPTTAQRTTGNVGRAIGMGGVGEGEVVHGHYLTRPPDRGQDKMTASIENILRAISLAEVRDLVLGSRPTRYTRRALVGGDWTALVAELRTVVSPPTKPARTSKRPKAASASTAPPATTKPKQEDPERVRERVAAWVAGKLELRPSSGSALLTALRHGAPVFVGVGSGGDDDEDAQGTDGAGGEVRSAAVLPAPDDYATLHEEDEAQVQWEVLLAALADLKGDAEVGYGVIRGQEAAEIVRRHHGLDSIAEATTGAGGESFASIGESGLVCSGRVLAKETVRKIYNRAIAALRDLADGKAPDLREEDFEDETPSRLPTYAEYIVDKDLDAFAITRTAVPACVEPAPRDVAYDAHREALAAVAW